VCVCVCVHLSMVIAAAGDARMEMKETNAKINFCNRRVFCSYVIIMMHIL